MTFTTPPEAADCVEEKHGTEDCLLDIPNWAEIAQSEWGEQLIVPEWEDKVDFRSKNGWKVCVESHRLSRYYRSELLRHCFALYIHVSLRCVAQGRDYIHDKNSPVRIRQYFVRYGSGQGMDGFSRGGVGTTLTGIVQFTPRAESHAGYCHGGSMCSVFDDAVGWCAFLATGDCKPWSGFTAQINTSLKRPILVNSTLLVKATIARIERRKVHVEVTLFDPAADDVVHAKGDGLVVLNRGVLPLLSSESTVSTDGVPAF